MTHVHTSQSIQLTENSSPTNPASGHVSIYPKTDGFWYQRDASGNEFRLGICIVVRDEFMLPTDTNTDTEAEIVVFPSSAVSTYSTGIARLDMLNNPRQSQIITAYAAGSGLVQRIAVTQAGTIATNQQTDSYYITATTTAAAGNLAGWNSNSVPTGFPALQANPEFTCMLRTGATVTGARIWVGLTNGTAPNSDSITNKSVMFRFNGTGGWTPVTYNSTQTTGTTIGTVAVNSLYMLRIRVQGLSAYFSVNNGTEQVVSSNVPYNNALAYCCAVIATTASARQVQLSRMNITYDNSYISVG